MADVSEREAVERQLRTARGRLVKARSLLDATELAALDHAVPELDTLLGAAYWMLENCRRFLTLFRAPRYETYDLTQAARSGPERASALFHVDPDKECLVEGDAEQTMAFLRLIRDSAQLGAGQSLSADLYRNEPLPHIIVRALGGFALPEHFTVGPGLEVSRESLAHRWAATTRGGEVEFVEDGVLLGLRGEAAIPASSEALTRMLAPVRRGTEALRAWRGASGQYEPGYASAEEIARLYKKAVDDAFACVEAALS